VEAGADDYLEKGLRGDAIVQRVKGVLDPQRSFQGAVKPGIAFGGQTGLTYNVGPETAYEVASVDTNTQLTLTKPWGAKSFTGLAYLTYRPIKYIADVTGQNTDGVGGIVRITGSDDDQTAARNGCITASAKNFRLFRGFFIDTTNASTYMISLASNCSNWIVEDCQFAQGASGYGYIYMSGTGGGHVIRRCLSNLSRSVFVALTHSSTVNNIGNLIENCIITGADTGINIFKIGGNLIRNCTLIKGTRGVNITSAPATGQTNQVFNCIIQSFSTAGLQAVTNPATNEEITEDFNNLYDMTTNRTFVTQGANSVSYIPLYLPPLLFSNIRFHPTGFELSQWSALRTLTGNSESAEDFFALTRPAASAKKSWGSFQFQDVSRNTGTVRTGTASLKLSDAGRHQMFIPVTAVSTTFSVYVYREANYAGTNPQLVIRQPGKSDTTVTDAGAASGWNLLTTTLTPNANPPYVIAMLVSNNTATSGSYGVYFDDLDVS